MLKHWIKNVLRPAKGSNQDAVKSKHQALNEPINASLASTLCTLKRDWVKALTLPSGTFPIILSTPALLPFVILKG